MKPCLLILTVVLYLTGCRSYPPEINEGRVVYPKYQISFETPPADSWHLSKRLPPRIIPRSDDYRSAVGAFSKIIFVNDEQDGVIALEVSKSFINAAKQPRQNIKNYLDTGFSDRAESIKTSVFFSDYRYDFSVPHIDKTPALISREKFNMTSYGKTYNCEINSYVYTINDDDTCVLRFIFWSAADTYFPNKATLYKLLKTLKRES